MSHSGIHCCSRIEIIIIIFIKVCVCGHCYPACNSYAPYCHVWSAVLNNIFPLFLITGTDFGKKVFDMKVAFSFNLLTFLKKFSF